MRALEVFHDRFVKSMGFMHKARWAALWRAVCALIEGKQLWLSALGRSLPGTMARKHAIKAIDRLLANRTLYSELDQVYAAIAAYLLDRCVTPLVVVDTMAIRPGKVSLSACLAGDGRSVPLFSIIVNKRKPERRVLRRFLKRFACVLPFGCRPILITDAGFESGWFDEVDALGWDYVGRVRNRTRFLVDGKWVRTAELYARAGKKVRGLGKVAFPQHNPRPRRLVLSKKPKSGHRKRMTTRGTPRQRTEDKRYRKAAHDPWLLATSLSARPSLVVSLYTKRMQIEETFRDTKNHRWGWAVSDTRSRSSQRIEILLLIAAIAYLPQLLVGIAGERKKIHHRHQANTVRARRVISLFVLGGLMLAAADDRLLRRRDLTDALKTLRRSRVFRQA